MNKEVTTIPMKVRKIVRRKPMNGPDLLEFHLSILSYHPKGYKIKEHPIPYPSMWCTTEHLLPTSNGFKKAEKFKIGDILETEMKVILDSKGSTRT